MVAAQWEGRIGPPPGSERESPRVAASRETRNVDRALRRYFAGQVAVLGEIPIHAEGTSFQRAAWKVLRRVPPGATITYTELAARAGHSGAPRAAGQANSANPVSLVIPCHRAVGLDGALVFYGGGIARKRWLLDHEARSAPDPRPCRRAGSRI